MKPDLKAEAIKVMNFMNTLTYPELLQVFAALVSVTAEDEQITVDEVISRMKEIAGK